MALTLLPGMALAAEGENPQPVVVRTAEELRAAMETESIVSLANNIDLRNVTINPRKRFAARFEWSHAVACQRKSDRAAYGFGRHD